MAIEELEKILMQKQEGGKKKELRQKKQKKQKKIQKI